MGAKNNRNGRAWQLAFWIIAVTSTVFFTGMAANVIANDRLRALEDNRIEHKIDCIDRRLSRIEGKLGIETYEGNI